MDNNSSAPIGIFDSGIGGLTVARAIRDELPQEGLMYFGDTAHLPYGDKSAAAIQAYSIKITDVLMQSGCKLIVIACNSASSAAYELLKEYSGRRTWIVNVIDPMVDYVMNHHSGSRVGLIGTKQTIQSNVYQAKFKERHADIDLVSMATPLLVPMIEEGFIHNRISHDIIDQYLSTPEFQGISSLILGCTHYPLIRNELQAYLGPGVEILASSKVVADFLQKFMTSNGLLSKQTALAQEDKFLVSDFTESFEVSSKMFFGEAIHLEKHELWE